jgi:hypothetical protein
VAKGKSPTQLLKKSIPPACMDMAYGAFNFHGKFAEKLSTTLLTDNMMSRSAKRLEAMFITRLQTAIEFAIQQD